MNPKRRPYEWSESPPEIQSISESRASSMSLNFIAPFPTHSSSVSTPKLQSYCFSWTGNEHSVNEQDECPFRVNRFANLSLSNLDHHYHQEMSGDGMRSKERASEAETEGRLMSRPKPYSAFLDDVKKREFDYSVEAWKKAQELAILDQLKRKEAVISDWEYRHSSKATEEMKNYENMLEKKRAKMLEKLQKSISMTKEEANKKALRARHEAKEKMSQVSKLSIKARATNNLSCLKL